MHWWEAAFLGLVQGLTEFLPISSSGHLVLFQRILGVQEGALTFDVFVHLGTLVAVVAVFWQDLLELLRHPWGKMARMLIVGTVVTGVIGIAFRDAFETLYESGSTLGYEFLATGLILWLAERLPRGDKGLDRMRATDAAVTGLAQGLAILPAISRSGLTIAGALAVGLRRDLAARFSFLLSIPAILGAAVLELPDALDAGGPGVSGASLVIGATAAAIAGYVAIRWMLRVIARERLSVFTWYLWILGALILLDQFVFHRFF